MAETASSLLTALSRRIRDPNSAAHTSTNVIPLLSHLQRLVNAATGAVRTSQTLALPPDVPHNLTDMTVTLTSFTRIDHVVYQTEDLPREPWQTMHNHNPFWPRASGSRPLMWDMIGRGLLVVTPTILQAAQSVVVEGPKVTTALAIGSDATELPDEHMATILAFGEQLLLLRQRLLASIKPAVEHAERVLPRAIP